MKREIKFGSSRALLERDSAVTGSILISDDVALLFMAILADELDLDSGMCVRWVLPEDRSIIFAVAPSMSNSDLIDLTCEAISKVFDCDTSVSYPEPSDRPSSMS